MNRPTLLQSTSRLPLLFRLPALVLLALLLAIAPSLAACTVAAGDDADGDDFDDMGIDGPFQEDGPVGKEDSAGVPGPAVNTNTSDTQVWTARNKWEDTDTEAARLGGIAWPADSGLTWDQKYQRWVESMPRIKGFETYYETFTLTTPWGKNVPAPKLECAEVAIFLRATFAAWYQLPFYMTAVDASGTRIYFGHFGARTKTTRYANTPQYALVYQDYSNMPAEQYTASWPRDEKLRTRGLDGPEDDTDDFIEPGARSGAYLDEIHLNKRAAHFTRLLLAYFGSANLVDSRNTYNIKPESILEGDVLVERWQRNGIGHTLLVKTVNELDAGQLEAELASGSMPRRQPLWDSPTGSKGYFTSNQTGGEGTAYDGSEYVKLGGGIKRWRVTKNINGYWTNTWMKADESSWISDTDYEALKARPATFERILGEASPEVKRDALLQVIQDKRNHLMSYPASCSARTGREEAFDKLYALMQEHFNTAPMQVDAQYRQIDDYVFAELEYTQSKTCCWNSTTAAMYQIIMDYEQSLMQQGCVAPVVFKWNNGLDVFQQFAEQSGRGSLWKPWSADESCSQQNVAVDTEVATDVTPYCSLQQQQ
jgi:hypothetical protein